MIPSTIPRCQGRSMNTQYGSTLAEECTDCARRTCIEPGQTYSWMTPPQIIWSRVCGSWMPDGVDEVIVLTDPTVWPFPGP